MKKDDETLGVDFFTFDQLSEESQTRVVAAHLKQMELNWWVENTMYGNTLEELSQLRQDFKIVSDVYNIKKELNKLGIFYTKEGLGINRK